MPKIRRANLPPAIMAHLLLRVRQRGISVDHIRLLASWLDTEPEVPRDQWYKRFPDFILCGEGELIKTFLLATQTPVGVALP